MNKYLVKIDEKEATKKPAREGSVLGATLLAGSGLGTIANQYSRGNLTGRETLYHGSTKSNIDNIKSVGLLPNRGGGVSNIVSPDLEAKNSPYTFSAKDKLSASIYSAQQEAISAGQVQNARDLMRQKIDFQKRALPKLLHDKGTVAKINLPTHLPEFNSRLNPEVKQQFRNIDRNIFSTNKDAEKKQAYTIYQKMVHTNKGAIPAEYVKGSPSYKPNSLAEIASYVRKNPKRFLKGVGMVGVGTGLLAGSAYAANPNGVRSAIQEAYDDKSN
jgi:hypothetical protein